MTTLLTLEDTVGEWVANHPATSRVFEQHKLDYCCGGGKPLKQACLDSQIDAKEILAELAEVLLHKIDEADENFASLSLAEMCDSIEATHHEYLRRELPRLNQLVEKVVSVHGNQHAWLGRLATSFQELRGELVPHMMKEEQVLFPAIRTIEKSQTVPCFPFGSIDNPIRMMEHEHDVAGQALREIRTASSDYALPEGACNTFRAMLDSLRELEEDLHRHIHKENNVLFPHASRLVAGLGSKQINEGIQTRVI